MNSICLACPFDPKIIRVVTPAVPFAVGRATKVPRYGFFLLGKLDI